MWNQEGRKEKWRRAQMTYMLAEYPFIDLAKLRWSLDCEVLRRIWWIFPIIAVMAGIVFYIRSKK